MLGKNDRPLRGDEGITLIEMIVAMSIFSVLLVVFASAVTDWSKDVVKTSRVGDQTSTARTVFNLFDKQVPAAAALNRPVLVGTDWYLEMENDATTPSTCVQWRLRTATHQLQWRSWLYNPPAIAATPAWRTVDSYAVQSKDRVTGVAIDPFVRDLPDQTYLTQRLTVDVSTKKANGPTTQNRAVFSARNTNTLTPTNVDVDTNGVSTQICLDIVGART